MKKYILGVSIGLLTTAAVTATVLSSQKKTTAKKEVKTVKAEKKTQCSKKMERTHCFDF
jgi:predicted small secreted protein